MTTSNAVDRRFPSAIAVERAAKVLTLLADMGDSTVSDLARALDVSPSVIHRILTAMRREQFVEQDPLSERYRLSWTVLKLARKMIANSDVREIALPYLRSISMDTQETATLSVKVGFERVLIEQVVSEQEVHWRAQVGTASPLYAGATGKVILAYMAPPELNRYFAHVHIQQLTAHTETRRRGLEDELAQIRRDGFAVGDRDRIRDVAGASAPIFTADGEVKFAISIAGPSQRCSAHVLRRIAKHALVPAAHEISFLLGYQVPASAPDPVGVGTVSRRAPGR